MAAAVPAIEFAQEVVVHGARQRAKPAGVLGRHERTDDDPAPDLVWPEHGEQVAMTGLQHGVEAEWRTR
jgi:hypothetical protein